MKRIFEKVYFISPVVVQNIVFSAYGYTLKRKRYNDYFNKWYNFFINSQWFDEKQINDYQLKTLRSLIKDELRFVPYYKDFINSFDDIDNIDSIEKLLSVFPIINKPLVVDNYDDFISRKYKVNSLNKALTSGTSGLPLKVMLTNSALAAQWAIWWRHRSRFGLLYSDRQLMIGARVPISKKTKKGPFWRHDIGLNRTYLSSYHINSENIFEIKKLFDNYKYDYISGYPSAISELSELFYKNQLVVNWRPKAIITGSDKLGDMEVNSIKKVFNTTVTDQYGMVEFCGNISSCEKGNYHLDFECGIVEEVLLENGWVKLIFTGLLNPAMPLIRYDVGDTALPINSLCSCGRKSRAYEKIGGRYGEFIILKDGTKVIGLNQIFEYALNIKDIQLVQNDLYEVKLYVVTKVGFKSSDLDLLIYEFNKRTNNSIKLVIHFVEAIYTNPTEKKRAVQCNIDTLR